MSRVENSCAERIEPVRWGVMLFNDTFPKVYGFNFLRLEGAPLELDLDELLDELDELQGRAGHEHRHVVVEDEALGAALAPRFRTLGWDVATLLVMGYRGELDLPETGAGVGELTASELRDFRARSLAAGPAAKDPVATAQLIDKDAVLAASAGARFFGALLEGRAVCCTDLYSDGVTAQIEAVLTLEPYRKRGFGRVVVAEALGTALAEGHDLVFLVADDEDWPKELYARMGFEPLGRCYDFLKSPP